LSLNVCPVAITGRRSAKCQFGEDATNGNGGTRDLKLEIAGEKASFLFSVFQAS
jgi:hypothetical protein